MLEQMGAHVENADDLARELAATPDVRAALTDALGRSFYSSDGTLKRSELAAYIFHHPDALRRVNEVIHPRVVEELARRYDEVRERPGCFVVETALAVETGYVEHFDVVVAVTASRPERLRRLVDDKGLTADQAVARMAAQLPEEEKLQRADIVIVNDGTLEELASKARDLFEELCTDG